MKPFSDLSPAQIERLALLMEELAEAQQVIGKILRHGYSSYHPDFPETSNRELLERELGDVRAAILIMTAQRDISDWMMQKFRDDKMNRIGKYLHHNEVVHAREY